MGNRMRIDFSFSLAKPVISELINAVLKLISEASGSTDHNFPPLIPRGSIKEWLGIRVQQSCHSAI